MAFGSIIMKTPLVTIFLFALVLKGSEGKPSGLVEFLEEKVEGLLGKLEDGIKKAEEAAARGQEAVQLRNMLATEGDDACTMLKESLHSVAVLAGEGVELANNATQVLGPTLDKLLHCKGFSTLYCFYENYKALAQQIKLYEPMVLDFMERGKLFVLSTESEIVQCLGLK